MYKLPQHAHGAVALFISLVFLTSGATALFFGYTSVDKTRVGGPLSTAQEARVNEAINLIENSGNSAAATGLRAVLADGGINAETDETTNSSKSGNSADATGRGRSGPTVRAKRMNLGSRTLKKAVGNDPGGVAKLASSLIHEWIHISKDRPDNNEFKADLAQMALLCQLASGEFEGEDGAKEKEAICRLYRQRRYQASKKTIRPKDMTAEEFTAAYPFCPDCPTWAEAAIGNIPLSPDMTSAASFLPDGFAPGLGMYTPIPTSTFSPEFSFFGDPRPYFNISFSRSTDGGTEEVLFPITHMWPTAIAGDGENVVYLAGITPTGQVAVDRYDLQFSGDSVAVSGPFPEFLSGKMKIVSDLVYTNYLGRPRLFALDGAGGKFGYYDMALDQIKVMASQFNDLLMDNWRSFLITFIPASNELAVQLSRDWPIVNFYEVGDQLYLLNDAGYDGNFDTRTLEFAEDVMFPD